MITTKLHNEMHLTNAEKEVFELVEANEKYIELKPLDKYATKQLLKTTKLN